ncbi:NADH-quinone oxidoreductase subunit NuoK [Desulfurispira natronophila]|uniref:NADH-quinone oxidoreductase subunit K n=1 Tax=Desulfurispira natronophila TaxID=682562 RepID=A0A7W7Y497_9BACT|nr:NADH-quinone oxidoreductase subunit NuoK [Desulfurispira natronophila]MBB5021758.1 NADH-quinone oxidoreductase subunit K [Desulfurispira natronophila]
MFIGVQAYLALSIILFLLGVLGVMARRNVFTVFMSVELMLNAGNLAFVSYSRFWEGMEGHILAVMVMAVAAAEAALALAVVVLIFRNRGSLDTDFFRILRG